MSEAAIDQRARFARWFTGQLRGKAAELSLRPHGGDFTADLADWLITAGHVPLPWERIALDAELATMRAQRDRAWREVTVLEGMLRDVIRTGRASRTPVPSGPSIDGTDRTV